jgi:hypothetical protein
MLVLVTMPGRNAPLDISLPLVPLPVLHALMGPILIVRTFLIVGETCIAYMKVISTFRIWYSEQLQERTRRI